jgi:hypothetical protein
MAGSNTYVRGPALSIDRLTPSREVVAEARCLLHALRTVYPEHARQVGDLPERLAIVEGLLVWTREDVIAEMPTAEYAAWVVRRDAEDQLDGCADGSTSVGTQGSTSAPTDVST